MIKSPDAVYFRIYYLGLFSNYHCLSLFYVNESLAFSFSCSENFGKSMFQYAVFYLGGNLFFVYIVRKDHCLLEFGV